jgi:HK97 family phage prohead protease
MAQTADLLRYQDPSGDLFELRDEEGANETLVGHFAVFDSWTEINSSFEGRFLERIAPGAFDKTFKENRANMRVLFNHGKDPTVGEMPLGTIQELRAEDRGAYYEVGLVDGIPSMLMSGLRKGLYGASFRFRVIQEDFDHRAEESEHNPEGLPERTIKEARVMEFGPVTFPAYPAASAGLRSATDWWREYDLRAQIEEFVGGAAALEPQPGNTAGAASSRSTRVDHLATRREDAPWRL